MLSKKNQGSKAEVAALQYLQAQGLKLIKQNFYCKMGEIDLIMQDQETLVFVEVRQRARSKFGNAAMSITPQKQHRVIRTAQFYLQKNRLNNQCPCRIDAVCIDGDYRQQQNISWIKNAF